MKIIFIVFIFIIAGISYPLIYYSKLGDQNFYYYMKLDRHNNSEYEIIFPCILDKNNNTVDKVKIISGSGELSLIETEYGYGYHLLSSENVELKYEEDYLFLDKQKEYHYKFSLRAFNQTFINNSIFPVMHWIFLNSSSLNTLKIRIEVNYYISGFLGASGHKFYIISNLRIGWNQYACGGNSWMT